MSPFDSLEDSDSAVLELDLEQPVYEGPCCPQCELPMETDQMVCRFCGFYPSLGITVELDPQIEAAMNPEMSQPAAAQTAWEELTAAVPAWAWPIVGTNAAIVLLSTAGRWLLPAESIVFDYWGVAQLILGLALALALHITCFVMTASTDSDMGILDMVVSPLKAWNRTLQRLPARLWLVVGGSNGITLSLTAALIVGGIPWHRLWDWGIEAPTKTSLVEAIATAAGKGPSKEQGLEEAVQDFAGAAQVASDQLPSPAKPKQPKARVKTDCLIIGFKLDDMEQLKEILIATEASGRLLYAGKLVPELDADAKRQLKARLMRARTAAPIVKTGQVATWVEPRFPCRISYTEQTNNGRLLEMKWEELLPEIQLPW